MATAAMRHELPGISSQAPHSPPPEGEPPGATLPGIQANWFRRHIPELMTRKGPLCPAWGISRVPRG